MSARFSPLVSTVLSLSILFCAEAEGAAQVDLSVSGVMSPNPIPQGGSGTVTFTVHNAGPDIAGAAYPTYTISVAQRQFDVTFHPPPYYVTQLQADCGFDDFRSEETEDGHYFEVYAFYIGSIAPGQDRSCTYQLVLDPSTRSALQSGWHVHASVDQDVNPDNDVFPYVFGVEAAPPAPLPTWSLGAALIATGGMLTLGLRRLPRKRGRVHLSR